MQARIRRKLAIVVSAAALGSLLGLVAVPAALALTCNIVGNPTPPVHVSLGATYTMNVQGVPADNERVLSVEQYSGPSSVGPWTSKGSYGCSGTLMVQCDKAWDDCNQGYGSFWWRGSAYGTNANYVPLPIVYTSGYGAYITP